MVALSLVLVALAMLASLGCWLLMRGLWPAGARDAQAYALAANGLLLLLGAVALIAWNLPVLFSAVRGRVPNVEMPAGGLVVDFPAIATQPGPPRVDALAESTQIPAGMSVVTLPNTESLAPDITSTRTRRTRDDWPATDCVARLQPSGWASSRWSLRNECGRPVAVVFAWCDLAATECLSPDSERAGLRWNYMEEGVILSAGGVGQTPTDQAFVEHLACYVEAPTALAYLDRSTASESGVRLLGADGEMAEISDECLRVVRSCSRYGNTLGRSPAVLFR